MNTTNELVDLFIQTFERATIPEFVHYTYRFLLSRDIDGPGYVDNMSLLYKGYDRKKYIMNVMETDEFMFSSKSTEDLLSILKSQTFSFIEPFHGDPHTLEQYQDIWVKGKVRLSGIRECEQRYSILKKFCSQYKRPFTVLDIGANLGYFSIRLTEDFDCTVIAVEGTYGNWLREILEENDNNRVVLLNRTFSLDDVKNLAAVEHFDLVLALSVIHHFPDGYFETLNAFRELGDHLIIELPNEINACGQAIVSEITQTPLPEEANILGYGQSHLEDTQRIIIEIATEKTKISKPYLGCPSKELSLAISSNFIQKKVRFFNKPDEYDWYRGINLHTYLWMNGIYPSKKQIGEMLRSISLPEINHSDIQPWNFILQGDKVVLIDANDPNQRINYPDADYLERVIQLFEAQSIKLSEDELGQTKSPKSIDQNNLEERVILEATENLIRELQMLNQQKNAVIEKNEELFKAAYTLIKQKDDIIQWHSKLDLFSDSLLQQQKEQHLADEARIANVLVQKEEIEKKLSEQLLILQKENSDLRFALSETRYELNSVYHSKSWLMTYPLRFLFRPIRWILKKNNNRGPFLNQAKKGKIRQWATTIKNAPLLRNLLFWYKNRYPLQWEKTTTLVKNKFYPVDITIDTELLKEEAVTVVDQDQLHYVQLLEKEIAAKMENNQRGRA